MDDLIRKYNINSTFYKRYFRYGAEIEYIYLMQDFMLFKKGKFLNPQKKQQYIDEFCTREILDFYEKEELVLPKIDFDITTRCTLKCKHCSNLMPQFRKFGHYDMTFDDFKKDLDSILNVVREIKIIQIIGGEPLLHPELNKMVEYAAKIERIGNIKIITNATVIPSSKVLEMVNKYNNKVHFYISNYSKNEELRHMLKTDELIKTLKNNNIKYQTMADLEWDVDEAVQEYNYCEKYLKQMFSTCVMASCLSIMNHKLHICAKSASGEALNIFEAVDAIKLINNPNLKEDIINFYHKEYFEACKYCRRTNTKVIPALQEE